MTDTLSTLYRLGMLLRNSFIDKVSINVTYSDFGHIMVRAYDKDHSYTVTNEKLDKALEEALRGVRDARYRYNNSRKVRHSKEGQA